MRTQPDPARIRDLCAQVEQARQLLDQGKVAEGFQALSRTRAQAQRLGIASSFVEWGLAVAADRMGELEMAYDHIVNAVRHDPLHAGYQRSFGIIMDRLRAALADPARRPDDPSTPKLYGLLVAAGETDVPAHLAMAGHLAATGRQEQAMKLLDAVTLLAQLSLDAWEQKASLARTMGDAALAVSCQAEAAAIARGNAPFGVPAPPDATC